MLTVVILLIAGFVLVWLVVAVIAIWWDEIADVWRSVGRSLRR